MPRPPKGKQPDPSNRNPAAPSPSSGRGPDERLPVNPRRTKVAPEQRKRVAKACNRCNQKRIKCSGDQPCRQCISGARECRYPPPAAKVTIAKADLDDFQATRRQYHAQLNRLRALEGLLQEKGIPIPPPEPVQTPPPDAGDSGAMSPSGFSPLGGDVNMTDAIDGTSEPADGEEDQGKLLTDNDGTERFLGETSGANYLDGCKLFIVISHPIVHGTNSIARDSAFLASRGRYQTFDSRPMNLPAVDPQWLPPVNEMTTMLTEISTYIQDGNGTFASGGIFYFPWEDAASIVPSTSTSKTANRHLALYHVGFALASLLKGQVQPSEQFFSRAWSLLGKGNPLDITLYTLDDVPVLALMALYLVENNRRDAAYICISNAAHVSIMHGAHRNSQASNTPALEGRKRTFWTVYILDRWLSCLMGRPPSFAEEAVTLPPPDEVPGLPSPAGLRANIQLADMSHMIVKHSYRPHKPATNIKFAKQMVNRLKAWNDGLPDNITLSLSKTLESLRQQLHESRRESTFHSLASILGDHTPPPQLLRSQDEQRQRLEAGLDLTQVLGSRGSDRAYLSLQMSYNQMFILAIRPAFLAAVKKLVAESYFRRREHSRMDLAINVHHPLDSEFRDSADAARDNLMIGHHIKKHLKEPGNKLLVADLHHIFNAAVVLLMYRISFSNWRTNDTFHIQFAQEVFDEEAKSGSEYGKDCYAVLTEMDRMVEGLRDIILFNRWTSPSQEDASDPNFQQREEQLMSWREDRWEDEEDDGFC